jgi:putative transposase
MRPEHTIAPNVLERDFTAPRPNQKWVADFTYIWPGEGWLFLAVVLDLYSRRVVGWSMQADMTAPLVLGAPDDGLMATEQAVGALGPQRPGQSIYE